MLYTVVLVTPSCSTFHSHSVSISALVFAPRPRSHVSTSLYSALSLSALFSLHLDIYLSLCLPPCHSPVCVCFFLQSQVLNTQLPVTCLLGKEASWLWFVFLLHCRGPSNQLAGLRPPPPYVVSGWVSKHCQACPVSVATGQQGLQLERRGSGEWWRQNRENIVWYTNIQFID